MSDARPQVLATRIRELEDAIAMFERVAEQIRERRRGATDHVMVELDERLEVNTRTLACLRRTLEITKIEVRSETYSNKFPAGCRQP